MTNGLLPGQLVIQFGQGATPANVTEIGHENGLQLVGGPLISGPLPPGSYVFDSAQGVIQPDTPTTAVVLFPKFTKPADRLAFLATNKLRFVRWLRASDPDFVMAFAKLPPANLKPVLLDPITGRFRISLPQGLTFQSVVDWATQNGINVISYDSSTGSAVVHPKSWRAPLTSRPGAYVYSQPYRIKPTVRAPSGPILYVQFATDMTSGAIASAAQGLGLGVLSISASNLAVLSVDQVRIKAEIQLLTDLASVQCVSVSPNPCAVAAGPGASIASPPLMQQLGQPAALTAQLRNGILELDWSAAAGATGYAVFASTSSAGPYQFVAVVAGRQHTAFDVFDPPAAGSTAFYAVLAIHACSTAAESASCDSSSISLVGDTAPRVTWVDATTTPPPPTAAPQSSPSPSSDGSIPAAPTPAPATSQAPAIQPGELPLAAPTALDTTAADGHVVLTWAAVPGAAMYRVYRAIGSDTAVYIAQTSQQTLTDVGGTSGTAYTYHVAAVAPNGLVGVLSAGSQATWMAATTSPTVLRSLPAQSQSLSGQVRFEIDAESGSGTGSVQWRISGPAAALTIGVGSGRPNASAALSWSSAITWDSADVPDGTYTVTATVTDAGGPQVSVASQYRIQNGAPLAPVGLNAVAGPNGVALTWQQADSASAVEYHVFRDAPISGTPIARLSADNRSYVDRAASVGQHVYQIVLVDASGHQSPAAAATVTVRPLSPAPAATELDIKLLLPNGDALAPGGRVTDRVVVVSSPAPSVRFQLSSDGSTWSDIGQLPECGDTCTINLDARSLAPGPYEIRAVASDATSGARGFVRADAVRYAAPGSLSAVAGPLGASLRWTLPSGALPAYYLVERSSDDSDWQVLDRVAATSYIDSGAPTGSQLWYRVTAVDLEGTAGLTSTEASVSLPSAEWANQESLSKPMPPTGVEVTSSHGRATLQWQTVPGSDSYVVERQSDPGAPFAVAGITATDSFSDAPALSASDYSYRVIALNGTVASDASGEASTFVQPIEAPGPAVVSTGAVSQPQSPTSVKTAPTNGGVTVSWVGDQSAASATTYTVYRLNPTTGTFVTAATGLRSTTYLDSGLTPQAKYGYVVTASSPGSLESRFSAPAWVTAAVAPTLQVDLVAPVPNQALIALADNAVAIARVNAAAGLAGISFDLLSPGGVWKSLPTSPLDPRAPNSPSPAQISGAGSLWITSFKTTSLAPGTYQLRVHVADRTGREQDQTTALVIGTADARGPPSLQLTANPSAGGIHLNWTSTAGPYVIQRSLFGVAGPFETLATTQSTEFDDRTATSGFAYAYRIVAPQGGSTTSVAQIPTTGASPADASNGPQLNLGPVSAAELSVDMAAVTQPPALTSTLKAFSSVTDVSATSLASGAQAHLLGEPAQLTFQLPAGSSTVDAAAMAIYHWDSAAGAWVKESAVTNPDATSITATVDHLSLFVLASTNPSLQSANPPPPSTGLNQPGGSSNASPPPGSQPSWASLPVNPDGEVPSLRTSNSSVFKTAGGGFQQVISAALVNFKDANGTWQKIDTSLVSAGIAGHLRNSAGPLSFDLPRSAGAIVVTAPQGSLTMSIRGAGGAASSTSASSVTYASLLPGIDATYQVVPSGLNESLVLRSQPTSAITITYDLTTSGLVLSLGADGSVTATDIHGGVAFVMPAPTMMETPSGHLPGPSTNRIAVTLTGGVGSYVLTYKPDMSWLQAVGRQYPVTIDPSFTVSNENDSLGDQFGNVWCCGGWTPNHDYPVGYDSNGHIYRVLVQLDGGNSYQDILCRACYASTATLHLDEATDNGYGHPITISAYETATRYTLGTNTFNMGTQGSPATSGAPVGSGWFTFDVSTIVKSWQSTAPGAAGDFLITGNESSFQDIFIYDAGASGAAPYLTINYPGETLSSTAVMDPITAQPGSILSVPLQLTNPSSDYIWSSTNVSDIVRVGVHGSTNASGAPLPVGQPLTFLPSDVGTNQTITMSALIQAPLDPGDYWYTIDLRRDSTGYPKSTTAPLWFSDLCDPTCGVNQPVTVHVRVVAPGDQQAASVPITVGDGSTASVNSSNGSSTLSATDLSINELGDTTLSLSRTYNSVNGNLTNNATNNSNSTYGVGWTYSFQRTVALGTWMSPGGLFETLRNGAGLYTDSSGKTWPLIWNPGRGLWEDAAGGRTVSGPIAVDMLERGSSPLGTDNNQSSALLKHFLVFDGSSQQALIMRAGTIPNVPGGSIELWFRPDFAMSGSVAHTLAADSNNTFYLNWNANGTSHAWCLQVYDKDTNHWATLCSGSIAWTQATWHQIAVTWSASAGISLYLDGAQIGTTTPGALSPLGDMYFGYQPIGGNAVLNGAITGLRIDSSVLSSTQIHNDYTSVSETSLATTLYLGTYVNSPDSAGTAATYVAGTTFGYDVLTNTDQSQEIYDPGTGHLVAQRDRMGNQIDYAWDTSGRITTITDHTLPSRALTFCYASGCGLPVSATFRVTDPAGRTVDYTVNGSGDLVGVVKSNAVPDPLTGVITQVPFSTSYGYTGAHLLQTIQDPRGSRTNINYDSSYRQAVMADLPSNYWRLGDNSTSSTAGGAADAANPCAKPAVGSCNGTYSGGVTLGQRGAAFGDTDTSVAFDGSTGSLAVSGFGIAAGAPYTIEAWVKPNTALTGARTIVGFTQGAGAGEIWLNSNVPTFRVGTASSFLDVPATTALNSAWHDIVATYDGTSARLYVDGVLVAGPTAVVSAAGSTAITIGSLTAANFFGGNIDEVAIYPAALPVTRILAHFDAGRVGLNTSTTGYAASVISDSPLGFWRLGEFAGNQAIDQSGFVGNGTYNGGYSGNQGPPLTTDPTASTYFNGSSSYVTLPTYSITNAVTVEAWVFASTYNQSGFIVGKNPVNENWELFVSGNTIYWRTGGVNCGTAGSYTDLTTPAPSVNMWHHLVAVENGAIGQIYIDGVLAASSSSMDVIGNTANPVEIGRFGPYGGCSAGYYFNGDIADVAVYSAALSAARVLAHYTAGKNAPATGNPYPAAVLGDGPYGYWRLGESSGTTAADSTGHGYGGVYSGGYTLGRPGALSTDPATSTKFDGSTAYVGSIPVTNFTGTSITVEAWVYATTFAQNGFIVVRNPVNNNWELFFQNNSGTGYLYWRTGGGGCSGGGWTDLMVAAPAPNMWHQIAVSQSGTTAHIYIDGALAATSTAMNQIGSNGTGPIEIGRYGSCAPAYYFSGSIQDVSIYQSALSLNKIFAHYQASLLNPAPAPTPGGYAANIALDNPLGYWRLDEPAGSTTVYDRSGNAAAGTVSGSVTLGVASGVTSDSDTAARFDGSTGYISVADNPNLYNSPYMTAEAWINASSWVAGVSIVNRRSTANNGGFTFEVANTSGQIYFDVYVGGAWRAATSAALSLGVWHHIVGTYDGATVRVYVDGALSGSLAIAGTITAPTSPSFLIGRNITNANLDFNGYIDEVAVYGSALSASRIVAHYAAGSSALRIVNVQDPRGTTASTFNYNDDVAMTQVVDGLGEVSYYTFQHVGGRTVSYQDPLGNLTTYAWNGRSAFQLDGTLSPSGILSSSISNSLAPVGQQAQSLVTSKSNQPPDQIINLAGANPAPASWLPDGAALSGTWTWDYRQPTLLGTPSHSSPFVSGTTQQHYFNGITTPLLVPTGAVVTQWVYFQAGATAPTEIMLQFYDTDAANWEHRAYWGANQIAWGTDGTASRRNQSPFVPLAGHWVPLTVQLGPVVPSAATSNDVGLAGHHLGGVAYDVYSSNSSGGTTWWGPTILDFPPAAAPSLQVQTSTFAYNQTNDLIAAVDPNGVATVTDYDANGLARQVSTGVHAPTPPVLFEDPLMYNGNLTNPWTFEHIGGTATTASGSTTYNGYGSLAQTQVDNASESDLYRTVSGLRPGTDVRVSVWVSASVAATGGAMLWVDDGLLPVASTDSPVQRQTSIVQPAPGAWTQLSLPFLVDQTGKLRVHLLQINYNGTTTWADVRIEDITPVPDITQQATRATYLADFEQSTDRSLWTLTSPSGGVTELLNDATRSHDGSYSVHISSPTTSATGSATRAISLTPGYSYHVSAWVKTVASGSYSATSGAGAQIQLTTPSGNGTALSFPVVPAQARTNGQWQLLSFDTPQIWYGAMSLTLSTASFAGDVYFDDVQVEQTGTAPSVFKLIQSASATGTTPVTVTFASPGTRAGDLLVATVQEQGVGFVPSAPAGWTKIEDSEFKAGTSIWYLNNVAAGVTSFAFSTTSGSKMFVNISEWSGADPGAPVDVHMHGSQAGPSLQATASVSGASTGDLAITAFTEQSTTGDTFTPGGAFTNLASNSNFGSGNVTSGTTDQELVAAGGTVSERVTSSAAPAGSNWDWVIATFRPQPAVATRSTYWFAYTDVSFFTAADVHIYNPGTEPAVGALVIPGQTAANVNVPAGADGYISLKTLYPAPAAQLDPIELVTSAPVIASMRSQRGTAPSSVGFNEAPAQSASAAASTLYLSYYDSTSTGGTDYIHVFNPGSLPVTGSVSGSCVPANSIFSIGPASEQVMNFANVKCGPITITATGPILASQRVYVGTGYSEVPAQAAAAAAMTDYFSNAGNATTTFYAVNPAYSGSSWTLTATVAGSNTMTSSGASAELSVSYTSLAGGPVVLTTTVPALISERIAYTTPSTGFLEINGVSTPATTQYFNWYDLASNWVSTDAIVVSNPNPTTTATGTITEGANTLPVSVAGNQSVSYTFAAGIWGGPVSVVTSIPVVVSQKVATATVGYRSEIDGRVVPANGLPGAPTTVVAIPGNGQATVEWGAPTSSGSSSISSYQVTSSAGSTQTVTGTTATFTGLTNNTGYDFWVAATNASGQGPWSQPSSIVVPGTTNVGLPMSAGWQLVTSGSATATATQQLTGGVGGGAARTISITASSTLGDVKDVLALATLRSAATYVISAWVSATSPGTVDFSLRDGSGNLLPMDQTTTCAVTTTPSLCEGSLTYTGADYQPAQLTLQYGGQGVRTITVSHPLIALSAERDDYTSTGQLTRTYDVFGQLSQTDYDNQGLYPIDTVQRMSVDYHQTVLADTPLAYWPLEDGSGASGVDLAGNHPLVVTGSLTGSAVLPVTPGVHSLTNDGTAISVASSSTVLSALNDSNGQSIEMWVSLNGIPAYNDSVFALTGTGTGHLDRWNGDGTAYPADFEAARHHFNVQIPTTGVHYIVYTRRTGGRFRLYIDGVLVGDDPAGTFGVPLTFYLGGNGSNLSFKGNVADVALYNSELTPTQVTTHYQVGMGQLDLQPPSYGNRERASYSAAVAADAPVGYWRLGDAGGTTALDASGHGLAGAYHGAISVAAGALTGDANTSAAFDGATAYVSVPGAGLTASGTLEAWVKGSGAWLTGTEAVLSSGSDSLSIVNGHPYASFYIGGTAQNLDSGVTISTGAWHHLAASWDGHTIRIYIDGSLAAFSNPAAGNLNEVGAGAIGSVAFAGAIDDAAIYATALPLGRLQAHYWAGASQVTASTSAYSATVLADHPGGYWQLNDSSGTSVVDTSGNGNTGALAGGITLNQPGAPVDGTNAMTFNGSTGVITVSNATSLNPTTALSMEAWVYLTANPSAFTNLVDKSTYNQYRLGLDTTATPLASIQVTNGSVSNYVDNCPSGAATTALALNQWHHLVYTFDGVAGTVTMYEDGYAVCQSSQTDNGNALTGYNRIVAGTSALVLGRDTGGTGYLNGRLGEVGVYTSALSAGRVLAHFDAAQVQFPNQTPYSATTLADKPRGYWRLGEGTGSLALDSSGNGNNGVVSGGVTLGLSSPTPDGNSAALFDGSTGIITIPNSPSLNAAKGLTLETWVYFQSVPTVFTNLIDKNNFNGYRLGLDGTGSPKSSIQVTNGSAQNYVDNCPNQSAPPPLAPNQWHLVTFTFDGVAGTVTLYEDGAQVCQSTQTNNGNLLTAYNTIVRSTNPVVIGRDTGGTGYFNGRLDDVAIYGTALPAGRILSHYQASIFGGRHLVTGVQTNTLGQRTALVTFNGPASVVDQYQLDSWGRLAREVQNSSVRPADAQTNVVTGMRYDLNGNLIDTYGQQAQVAGTWIDSHSIFDANNNLLADIQNCTGGSACNGGAAADQNVVVAYAYDALNRRSDSYSPMAGCTASCVPVPICSAADPVTCTPLATPCPTTTCVDDHTTYDPGGRQFQEIANYGGTQNDPSQVNVTTTYTYDSDGRLTQLSEPITGYNYGQSSLLQSGFITQKKAYDLLGQLVSDISAFAEPSWMPVTQPAETDYTLDAGGRVVAVTGPGTGSGTGFLRVVTVFSLDDLGRTLSVTNDWGTVTTAGPTQNLNAVGRRIYDPRGSEHSFTPPTQQLPVTGLESTTNYNLAGQPVAAVADDGTGGLHLTTTTLYDALGRAVDVIDPRGIDTHAVYDALDRLINSTANYCPAGSPNTNCSGSGSTSDQNVVSSVVYDLAGNQIQTINPRGIVQYATFDALGRQLAAIQNCTPVPTPPSTSCGTQTFDQNVASSHTYDQAGNVLTTIDPLGRKNVYAYDALGRKVSQTINCVNQSGQCDAGLGTNNDQNLVTTWQVDAQGDVLQAHSPRKSSDGQNLTTAYVYDALLRLYSVTEDLGPTQNGHLNLLTSYGYDQSGHLLSQTDGRTFTTNYTIDHLGRTTQVADAGSGIPNTINNQYTYYDLAGEAVGIGDSRTNLSNNTNAACNTLNSPQFVCYTLDRLGRRVGVSYLKSNGSTQLSQTFAYDANGNMTSFSDSDVGQTTITYDHLNRVSTVTSPAPVGSTTPVTTYTYNADGVVTAVSDATGSTNFTVDHLDRPATMVDPLTGATTSYTVDAAGRLTRRTEANGIVTTPTYTGVDLLASKTEVLGANTLASWTNIAYDAAQNRTAETLAYPNNTTYPDPQVGTTTYQYDNVNQLSQGSIPVNGTPVITNYAYDAAHNLTTNGSVSQTYFNNEALNLVGATGVGSDAVGNEMADASGHAITWNALSQLESFTGAKSETFTYDALGRLTTVTVNGALSTQFVYRGLTDQVVEELNGTGTLVRSYAWDSSGRQMYVKAGGTVYYEISNPHGDLVALANASGLAGTEHFDPWGNLMSASGSVMSPASPILGFPMGFQGTEGSWTDPNNAFVYMAARWYYPKVGRFLSSDPAAGTASPRTPIQRSRWPYVSNNPIDGTDPTGLMQEGMTDSGGTSTGPPDPAPAPKPKPQNNKKVDCAWYDAVCKAKQAWEATKKVASDAFNACKSSDICKVVAPIVVSIAVGAVCSAVVGVGTAGVGEVGCLVLAGAVSGALSGALDCKNGESIGGCMATGAAVGAVTGLAGFGVGKLLGVAAKGAAGLIGKTPIGKAFSSVASRVMGAVESGASKALSAIRAGVSKVVDTAESSASRAMSAIKQGISKAVSGARTCAANSFAAGTLILMADGSEKPIDQVKVGDWVMAGDPAAGIERPEPVQEVIVGHGLKHLYDISVNGEVIEATYNHPFWVVEKQAFVWAQDLVPGEHLLLADGRAPPITGITEHDQITTVYNLSIRSIHTFFVGSSSVLVHNTCQGQVPYGSTELSQVVQEARVGIGGTFGKTGNFAAAQLDNGDIILGRSNGEMHAEEDLLTQAGDHSITDMYTERQPCRECAPQIPQSTNVTWSFPWSTDRAVQSDTNRALKAAIRALF